MNGKDGLSVYYKEGESLNRVYNGKLVTGGTGSIDFDVERKVVRDRDKG